jgi:type III secretion protein HrpB1
MTAPDAIADVRLDLIRDTKRAFLDEEFDRAESLLMTLTDLPGVQEDDEQLLVFRVALAVQRGQALDALRMLNNLDGDPCPERRAVCLRVLGDPTWHGLATEILETANGDSVRSAMHHLLGSVQAGQ